VRSIFCDRENNLWIGSRDRGVSFLAFGAMQEFSLGSILSPHHRRVATSDWRGHIWVLANDSLFEFWHDADDRWSKYRHDIPIARSPEQIIRSVCVDQRNRLWLMADNSSRVAFGFDVGEGITDKDGRPGHSVMHLRRIQTIPGTLTRARPIFLMVDRRDRIWLSTFHDGIARIDPPDRGGEIRVFNDSSGVPANYIRELLEDRDGNIWGTHLNAGIVRISPSGAVRKFTVTDGLPAGACEAIAERPAGGMLIGFERGGLVLIEGDSIRVISERSGLSSDNVLSVAVDSTGKVWLGTSIGVLREKVPGSLDFTTDSRMLGSGTGAIGMAGTDFSWNISGSNLRLYDLRADLVPTVEPSISLRSVRVNGADLPLADTLDLPHDQNTIEVGFAGIDFRGGGPSYMYRLLGADDRWHGPTRNRSILFGHLDPGSYRFQVEAVSAAGMHSPAMAELKIFVAPPYWRTWWFVIGCAVIAILVVSWTIRVRTGRILHKQHDAEAFSRKLIESQERERNRLAGELHDEIGQELLVMINRAQMGMRADSLEKARSHLEEVSVSGLRAIEEVRSMTFNLKPYHLEQLGLSESLRSMVDRVAASVPTRFSSEIDQIDGLLPAEQEIHLFRIVQECLNNIVKHSRASNAVVRIRCGGGALTITVSDDGRGIAGPVAGTSKDGFGLTGLTERARVMGGAVTINPAAGGGTIITASIPVGGQARVSGDNKS
jgi:signal transduction histidine kinase/streptogramin lyase